MRNVFYMLNGFNISIGYKYHLIHVNNFIEWWVTEQPNKELIEVLLRRHYSCEIEYEINMDIQRETYAKAQVADAQTSNLF